MNKFSRVTSYTVNSIQINLQYNIVCFLETSFVNNNYLVGQLVAPVFNAYSDESEKNLLFLKELAWSPPFQDWRKSYPDEFTNFGKALGHSLKPSISLESFKYTSVRHRGSIGEQFNKQFLKSSGTRTRPQKVGISPNRACVVSRLT